jgi:hypothetical protein
MDQISDESPKVPRLAVGLPAQCDAVVDGAKPLVRWVGLSGLEPLTSALSGRACGPIEWAGGRSGCPSVSSGGLLNRSQLSPQLVTRRTEVVGQAVRLHRLFHPTPIWTSPIFRLRL